MTFTGFVGFVFNFPLRAIIWACVTLRISPNILTFTGVVINVVAAWELAHGRFVSAGFWMVAANVFDYIDGKVASELKMVTEFGAFFDSVMDRISAAALALDALYRGLALDARREVLDAQVIALIATAELDPARRLAPDSIAEPRLAAPGSGLIAEIRDGHGTTTWRSPSMAGAGARLDARPAAGQRLYEPLTLPDGRRFLSLSLGVSWETGDGPPATYVFSAAESLEPYFAETARVRAWLLAGTLVLMLALVAGLYAGLRVGLRPLARLEQEIGEVSGFRGNAIARVGIEKSRYAQHANMWALILMEGGVIRNA